MNEERRDELNQVDEVQRVGDSVSEGRKKWSNSPFWNFDNQLENGILKVQRDPFWNEGEPVSKQTGK